MSSVNPTARSRRPTRRAVLTVLGTVVAIGGLVTAGLVFGGSGSDSVASRPPTTAPTTTTLASRTAALADELTAIICPAEICVDGSTAGVIEIDTKPQGEYGDTIFLSGDELTTVAKQLGLWSAADAQRMLTTRALDGTQMSTNGASTWTYHPDNGLNIIIDVESLPESG